MLDAVHFQDGSHPPASMWPLLLDSIRGYDCRMEFWFRHAEGEIDLILNHPNVLIGIEVKYYSGISSDDDNSEDVSPEESGHQLARYSRLLDDMRGGRFRFDLTKWNRLPSIADHWLFWEPYRYDNHFVIEQDTDGLWRSRTKEKSVPRYWGLKEAVGVTFPLTSVYNADTIRTELFGSMLRLPDLRSFNEPDHR